MVTMWSFTVYNYYVWFDYFSTSDGENVNRVVEEEDDGAGNDGDGFPFNLNDATEPVEVWVPMYHVISGFICQILLVSNLSSGSSVFSIF